MTVVLPNAAYSRSMEIVTFLKCGRIINQYKNKTTNIKMEIENLDFNWKLRDLIIYFKERKPLRFNQVKPGLSYSSNHNLALCWSKLNIVSVHMSAFYGIFITWLARCVLFLLFLLFCFLCDWCTSTNRCHVCVTRKLSRRKMGDP